MLKIRPYVSQVKTNLPLPSPYEGEAKRSYQFIDGVLYQVEVTVVASSEDVIVSDGASSSVPSPSLVREIGEETLEILHGNGHAPRTSLSLSGDNLVQYSYFAF